LAGDDAVALSRSRKKLGSANGVFVSGREPKEVAQFPNCLTPRSGDRPPVKGRPFLLAVLVLIAFAILFSIYYVSSAKGLRHYEQLANRVKSASNLRQISQAILQYTQDYRGQYPDSFATILLKEDVTSIVFVSPSRSETPAQGPTTQAAAEQLADSSHVSYAYLGRGFMSSTVKPEDIVAYERPIDRTSGANVLFGDGHVEFVDGNLIGKIAGQVATGIWPVTMPSQ
jgi:prepilin-type processing-associated H-X9-DG protein